MADSEASLDISVVLPAFNAAQVIEIQLEALACQDFPGSWEVIVSDNGSTDRLMAVTRTWSQHLPSLSVIDASAIPGAGFARNCGVRAARSTRIAFCDADDVVTPSWLTAIYQGLEDCDIVTGPILALEWSEFDRSGSYEEAFRAISSRPDGALAAPGDRKCVV
jgi:glycosyltransferase involved in cell wall biosynthesis